MGGNICGKLGACRLSESITIVGPPGLGLSRSFLFLRKITWSSVLQKHGVGGLMIEAFGWRIILK